ncbi:MAG: ABC transporter ATP-binding protein [Spirochaetaceae bacterium]|nr:MAG: ABC transporter ATP-binding protein [Spirochaetaceae bacterium]
MAAEPLLEIRELSRSFGGLKAVNHVSFTVPTGSIKSVIGPNGAGKTTLFNLISGMLPCDAGSVHQNGKDITGLRPHKIAELGICRTFQTTKLFARMTVLENVMVGRHSRTKAGFLSGVLNLPWTWKEEREIRERSADLLDTLGLADAAGELASNLPFGKQRLLEIARALATEPSLLLLDEPAAGLNIYETREMADLVLKIRGGGITVLLVEHDMSLVMDISDEIVVLNYGSMVAEGKPEEIQRDPEVIRIYLGGEHA